MEQAKLKEILEKHKKWLYDRDGGERANLSGVNLCGMNLSCANLNRADLSAANLSNADLHNANLHNANLSEASLRNANLCCTNLSGADLSNADLSKANLRNVNLSGADLYRTDLNNSDLQSANLNGSDLQCANLSHAFLNNTNFKSASLINANLSNTILSGAVGLLNPIDYLAEKFERTKEGYIVYKVFNECYESPAKWNIEPGEIITEEVNSCRANDCGCGINVAPLEWVKCGYPGKDIYKLLIKWEWLAGVVVPYNTDGKIRCARAQIIGKV